MRLSEWRKTAPNKESLSNRVLAILKPVLVDLGAEADADCWVCWGDDPEMRYSILAPTVAGLVTVAVRLSGSDGARATAKLVRWSKVSVSELGIDAAEGHRLVAVQVESQVLKGVDEEADRICDFVRGLIAGIENRNPQPVPIALLQSVGALGAGVAVEGAVATPSRAPAEPKSVGPATLKAASGAPKDAAGPAPKPAPKSVPKPAPNPAALVPVPVPMPSPTPMPEPTAVEPDASVKPFAPTPIAARAAAAQMVEQSGVKTAGPAADHPEDEANPAEWIGPHTIEDESGQEPSRPRRWTP
jgi:hypothetical protein